MTKRKMQHFNRHNNMAKNRAKIKKVILIVFIICFVSYVLLDFNLRTKIIRFPNHFNFMASFKSKNYMPEAYFVDTPGCRMPYFNISDITILQFINQMKNITCEKALTRVSLDQATLWLNMNDSEILERYNVKDITQVHCFYNEIKRKVDQERNEYLKKIEIKLQPNTPIAIPPHFEFIGVECSRSGGEVFYKDFHFFAVEKSKEYITANEKGVTSTSHFFSPNSSVPQVSVMLLGLESVSHLNFLRQTKQTAAYIHKHLAHVEFWGYNKVGGNTFPNLVATLTGLNETDLDLSCRSSSKNNSYDSCAFLWQRFKKAGYQTAYAEDVAGVSLFNFMRPGFKKQPTDYYMFPIVDEMEKHISYKQLSDLHLCKGGRRSVDVVLEMIHRLIPLYRRQLFFSLFWTATMTHDFWNMPQLLDADMAKLLATFAHEGILNNTVIFLMSDQGIRWDLFHQTYQGMMEERQPLLIALYPQWMHQQYPEAIANLARNAKRLTTPFDLYYTMLDLIDLGSLVADRIFSRAVELKKAKTMPGGISLFLPIPETRSCEMAGIASHWCTCHQKEELSTDDANVRHAARQTIELINDKLREYPQCQKLYLNSILRAFVAATHSQMLKEISEYDYGIDITVHVQTEPGLGQFESTVRLSTHSTSQIGTISRMNLYGNQSYCIDDYPLKIFCYCKEKGYYQTFVTDERINEN